MAEKQSILGRVAQLTRANINAILDHAKDPEKMLNQLVHKKLWIGMRIK